MPCFRVQHRQGRRPSRLARPEKAGRAPQGDGETQVYAADVRWLNVIRKSLELPAQPGIEGARRAGADRARIAQPEERDGVGLEECAGRVVALVEHIADLAEQLDLFRDPVGRMQVSHPVAWQHRIEIGFVAGQELAADRNEISSDRPAVLHGVVDARLEAMAGTPGRRLPGTTVISWLASASGLKGDNKVSVFWKVASTRL